MSSSLLLLLFFSPGFSRLLSRLRVKGFVLIRSKTTIKSEMCEMRISEKFYTHIARGRDTKTRFIITLCKERSTYSTYTTDSANNLLDSSDLCKIDFAQVPMYSGVFLCNKILLIINTTHHRLLLSSFIFFWFFLLCVFLLLSFWGL